MPGGGAGFEGVGGGPDPALRAGPKKQQPGSEDPGIAGGGFDPEGGSETGIEACEMNSWGRIRTADPGIMSAVL